MVADAVVGLQVNERNDSATLYVREEKGVRRESRSSPPWFLCFDKDLVRSRRVRKVAKVEKLKGPGFKYRIQPKLHYTSGSVQDALLVVCKRLYTFNKTPRTIWDVRDHVKVVTPEEQFLLESGITFFKNMAFDDPVWMALDIETCQLDDGVSFTVTDSPSNRIISIQAATNHGFRRFIARRATSGQKKTAEELEKDEMEILEELLEVFEELDPDIIIGHNICAFDFAYIVDHCRMHGLRCTLGRNRQEVRRWCPFGKGA